MKTIIIYMSVHHGNTEKIARVMAEVLDAKLVKVKEVNINELSEYDLIGFGSGIYMGKHHKSLLYFIDNVPEVKNRKAFIFSTSGMRRGKFFNRFDIALKGKLLEKGFDVVEEFSCLGLDTVGLFKLVGGINKGRPNEKDLENAIKFAGNLKNGGII